MKKPRPEVGQWWALNRNEGVIKRILPGGGGDHGIAEFEGDVPSAHVSTMLVFPAWSYLPNGPTKRVLPPTCTCVALEGGVILSDGCAAHDASRAAVASMNEPRVLAAETP